MSAWGEMSGTGILIWVLVMMGMLAVVLWLLSRNKKKSAAQHNEFLLMCEAVYQVGYNEQKKGRPHCVFWEDFTPKNSSEQEGLDALQNVHRTGYQDAADGKPSLAANISAGRQRQIEILEEMKTFLEAHLAVVQGIT